MKKNSCAKFTRMKLKKIATHLDFLFLFCLCLSSTAHTVTINSSLLTCSSDVATIPFVSTKAPRVELRLSSHISGRLAINSENRTYLQENSQWNHQHNWKINPIFKSTLFLTVSTRLESYGCNTKNSRMFWVWRRIFVNNYKQKEQKRRLSDELNKVAVWQEMLNIRAIFRSWELVVRVIHTSPPSRDTSTWSLIFRSAILLDFLCITAACNNTEL